ncbi:MAG: DUF6600 domain-containing protein [Terriglobales bacterium]
MSYRRVGLTLLMAAALGAGVLTPKALADSNARIVRLSYVDGDAEIDRRDGRGFEHAFLNMPLAPGTRVATRDDGRAEIEFEDSSIVRLTPGALLETQSLVLRSSGGKYTLVDLQEGTAYFNIRKLHDDDDFRVTTGRREFSLTRPSRFRLRVDRSQVVLAVFKGEVEVIGEGGRLTIHKDETLTLDLDDPARYFLAKGVSGDRYDDWDRERNEYRDRYASVGNYRGYSSYYSYGISDLNYWGRYIYVSGYGYMWRPYYYGVNWNPFNDGAWYWYPGYGWIWVSAYPWGWMPFRYGNWYYIGGHGWCWHPARHWQQWSPVVAVHNPPPGHAVPVAPPPNGRRDPVVVGHGPTTILPPEDPGAGRRGLRDPDALGRRGGNPAGGSGSGVVATSGSGLGATPSGGTGSAVTPGSGSGAPAGSGGSGQPAADLRRRSPVVRDHDLDIEEQIRNARERRNPGGSQSFGGSISSGGSGSGANSPTQDSSGPDPFAGRGRAPQPRREPPREEFMQSSGGSVSSGGSGSGVTSPRQDSSGSDPFAGRGRAPEPRREPPREEFRQSSGSSSSSSSPSSGGSSSGWSGGSSSSGSSGGSSGGSSSSSSSGSSSGHSSSGGSAGSSSGGSRSSSGTSSGSSHSSSGGRSSSSSSPKSSSPK